jgi:hypothetical protein
MSEKMLKVNVSKENIKKGDPGLTATCPIALAIKKVIKNKKAVVHVDEPYIQVDNNFYKLTKKAADFINKFDDYKKVKPTKFTFLLDKDF